VVPLYYAIVTINNFALILSTFDGFTCYLPCICQHLWNLETTPYTFASPPSRHVCKTIVPPFQAGSSLEIHPNEHLENTLVPDLP
jgi:hypothetical protein